MLKTIYHFVSACKDCLGTKSTKSQICLFQAVMGAAFFYCLSHFYKIKLHVLKAIKLYYIKKIRCRQSNHEPPGLQPSLALASGLSLHTVAGPVHICQPLALSLHSEHLSVSTGVRGQVLSDRDVAWPWKWRNYFCTSNLLSILFSVEESGIDNSSPIFQIFLGIYFFKKLDFSNPKVLALFVPEYLIWSHDRWQYTVPAA